MKKTLFSLFTVALCSASLHAQTVDVQPVLGAYNCDLYLSLETPVDSTTESMPNNEVILEKGDAKETITFAIRQFELQPIGILGDIVLKNIGLKQSGAELRFEEHAPVRLQLLDGMIMADVNINHTSSYIKGDTLYADVDIIWIQDPNDATAQLPIYVRVIGTKKEVTSTIPVEVHTSKNNTVYRLDGRRVASYWNTTLPKGVYIVNGKKILK